MNLIKLIIFLISLSIFACSESNKTDSYKVNDDRKIEKNLKPEDVSSTSNIDSSSIFLTIERGAFHYDKFILKDTLVTFYPSSDNFITENDNYNHISVQIISRQKRNQFIEKIIEGGFFKLKDSYLSNTSCNSNLTVTFNFNNQTKKIACEDFDRKCPELLKFIEQEIIRMHDKNLNRILLPG